MYLDIEEKILNPLSLIVPLFILSFFSTYCLMDNSFRDHLVGIICVIIYIIPLIAKLTLLSMISTVDPYYIPVLDRNLPLDKESIKWSLISASIYSSVYIIYLINNYSSYNKYKYIKQYITIFLTLFLYNIFKMWYLQHDPIEALWLARV